MTELAQLCFDFILLPFDFEIFTYAFVQKNAIFIIFRKNIDLELLIIDDTFWRYVEEKRNVTQMQLKTNIRIHS